MKKTVSPKDWVLLALAGLIDVIEEIRDPFDLIKNYYETYYGYIPQKYKKRDLSRHVWVAIKNKTIIKERTKNGVVYKITATGLEKIKNKFPRIVQKKQSWDGRWRLVIFDIDEERRNIRDSLRFLLKHLGFVQLQKSVWISPFDYLDDFKSYILKKNIGNQVLLIETNKILTSNIKMLINKLWDLDKINIKQKTIYEKLMMLKNGGSDKKGNKEEFSNIKKELLDTLLFDKYLPKELLPNDWYGNKLKLLVKKSKIF